MSCIVDAWIEDDTPRLALIDADSNTVRMAWQPNQNPPSEDVQHLFHQIFLALCGESRSCAYL